MNRYRLHRLQKFSTFIRVLLRIFGEIFDCFMHTGFDFRYKFFVSGNKFGVFLRVRLPIKYAAPVVDVPKIAATGFEDQVEHLSC